MLSIASRRALAMGARPIITRGKVHRGQLIYIMAFVKIVHIIGKTFHF